ncbi:MAG: TonB-dependent receptor [Candidatus Omnitrophica bacterium]|nr:TonB-dependent receptor [Candidatus Omnitrophota bacterium]
MKRYYISMLFISFFCLFLECGHAEESVDVSTEMHKEVFDIGKLVVTPSRIYQPYKYSISSIDIITERDIAEGNVLEFTEIVQMSPSVDVLENGSFGSVKSLRLRGANAEQTLTLMDGRSVNTPRDGLTDFNLFPVEAIQRVEVVRGPRSLIYGSSAVGGVINILPKQGRGEAQFGTNLTYGTYSTRSTAQFLSGSCEKADYYFLNDFLMSNGHREHSGYETHRAFANVGYAIGAGRLGLELGRFESETETPGMITFVDLDDEQHVTSGFVDLTYRADSEDVGDIMLRAYQNQDRIEFLESQNPFTKDTHSTKTWAFEGQYAREFHIMHQCVRPLVGLEFQTDKLDSTSSGKRNYSLKGAYVEGELRLLDAVTIDAGMRIDDYSNFGNETSPSIGISCWLKDSLKLRTCYGHSFRAPTFNDLYWPREDWGAWGGVEGNSNLSPETSDSYEIGIDYLWSDRMNVGVTYFQTGYDDLIEWAMDSSFWWRPENVGKAEIEGMEVVTLCNLPFGLFAEFNYSYFSKAENIETGKWLTYRPEHCYKALIKWSKFRWCKATLETTYKTRRYTNTDNTRVLGDIFRADISIASQVREGIEIGLKISNLFDREYEDIENYPVPGRAFLGTVRIIF